MYNISKTPNIKDDLHAFLNDSEKLGKLVDSKVIIIKPNLASTSKTTWDEIYLTDKKLLETVIEVVLELNKIGTVFIAESDSLVSYAYSKFEHLGLPDSLNIEKGSIDRVRTLDVSRDRHAIIKEENFKFFSNRNGWMHVSETVINADFLISLSNPKTHILCKYSGACKNLFGLLVDFDKSRYHGNINEVIYDINSVIKPDINIVDGFRGMQGNGPIYGEKFDMGIRIISDSATEADCFAAGYTGLNPGNIKYLKYLTTENGNFHIPAVSFKIRKPSFMKVLKYYIKGKLIKTGNWLIRR